ncbi:ribonuclease H-like domain-containing protein [Cerioporus squamosus]|nr:ribonuclease H-like domain-containing protein [Cerioporus squamosus]
MSAAEYTLSKQTPSNQLSRSGRAWYRSHFYDHPDYFPQRPAHSKDGDKTKVWCKKCFEQRVEEEKLGDIRQGVILTDFWTVWALDKLAVDRSRRWIAAAGPALLVHLIECPLISPEVSQRASREHEEKNKSPRRLHRNSVRMQAHPEAPAPQPTIAPICKVLTQRIIPNQVVHFRGIAQKTCRGKLVTVQCDGFTASNRHHIVAFMITVGGRVYSVRTFDTSTEPKTAEFLIRMMRQVIELVEKDWGARVIAMTSDCSGESRLARELLVRERPNLVGPDCYAHQVLRNYLLGILNEIQLNMPRNANGDPPTALSVIRGVLTRWTSNYLAYRRVLQLRIPLELLAVDNRIFLSGKEESHQRTRKMLKILKNPLFWHGIARVKLHLEPLAIAAHITQSNSCRLDDVVLTFGFLYRYFDNLVQEDPDDAPVRSAVLKSLTMRWDAADQDAMIGAAVLNPYLKRNLFDLDLHQYFSYARIEDLLCRLWDRFFPNEPEARPDHKMVTDYLQATGLFEVMPSTADSDKTSAQDDDSAPSLLPSQTTTNPRAPPLLHSLYRLAVYVLSICPTAANCEQLFSVLGIIMSDRRTRLTMDNLMNIAELRLHLRDEHVRKNTKARLKRHFGERISRPEVNTSEESSSSRNADTGREGRPRDARWLGVADRALLKPGDDDDELRTSNRWPSKLRIPLSKMFDFQSDFWSAYMARTHTNSLDEELAVWDLLDMDGDGEEDTGMDELAGILIAG